MKQKSLIFFPMIVDEKLILDAEKSAENIHTVLCIISEYRCAVKEANIGQSEGDKDYYLQQKENALRCENQLRQIHWNFKSQN